MTVAKNFIKTTEGESLVYATLAPVFRQHLPEDERPISLLEFIEKLFDQFLPEHITALTCVIHFDSPLPMNGPDEYVVRLRKWSDSKRTVEVRSSMGVRYTMERTDADVPIFFGDPQFVGLWLEGFQTDNFRVAYITHL